MRRRRLARPGRVEIRGGRADGRHAEAAHNTGSEDCGACQKQDEVATLGHRPTHSLANWNRMKDDGVGKVISAGGTVKVCRSCAVGHRPQANIASERTSSTRPTAILSLRMRRLYTLEASLFGDYRRAVADARLRRGRCDQRSRSSHRGHRGSYSQQARIPPAGKGSRGWH